MPRRAHNGDAIIVDVRLVVKLFFNLCVFLVGPRKELLVVVAAIGNASAEDSRGD